MNTPMDLENDNTIDSKRRIVLGITPIEIIKRIVQKIISGNNEGDTTNLSRRRFMGIKE